MAIFACSTCAAKLRVADDMVGRKCRCPKCGAIFVLAIPAASPLAEIAIAENSQPTTAALQPPTSETAPTVPHESPRSTSTAVADSPPDPRRVAFHADLRVLFRELGIRDPAEHIPSLAAIFDRSRQTAAERRHRFKVDLAQVYVTIAPPHLDQHLASLGDRLSQWRAKSKARMSQYFSRLPDDDPLRCPISLFGVMERGRLESAHTHVLAWLLDPRREHGFGDVLLVELLSRLCGADQVGSILIEKCEPEFIIEEGRLDVMLQGTARRPDDSAASWSWLLMIEAKIDATEGVQQLRKYDKWAGRWSHGREVVRLYLTPEGRQADTALEEWITMSFLDLACLFRKNCSKLSHAPGYHFLRYYIAGVLKDVYRWNLPIGDPKTLDDPYNFLEYLSAVCDLEEPAP